MTSGPAITGTTRLFAVVGDPVAQVQAPGLLNPLFDRLGLDAKLVPVQVSSEHFAEAIGGLARIGNLDGLLITVPHKIAACRFADERSTTVAMTGSANALRRMPDGRWFADNFDGVGFVDGMRAAGHSLADKRVALVGGGGAGSAIAVAVLDAGAGSLSICEQNPARLHDLLSRLRSRWPGRVTGSASPRLDAVDIAVNATPLGLRPDDPLPFAPACLPPGSLVADIIMRPAKTRLLAEAAALGHRVQPGISMLEHQLTCYRDFFRLDREPARPELASSWLTWPDSARGD